MNIPYLMEVGKVFEHSPIFILAEDGEVYQLPLIDDTRNNILTILCAKGEELLKKTPIEFDGTYKPNKDEYLYIDNFKLDDKFIDAIRNPIGVQNFEKEDKKYPNIKAIFIGEKEDEKDSEIFHVIFQLFRKDQRLSVGRINLFFNSGTFSEVSDYGFSIVNSVECYFNKDKLIFQSFYYARQIFDLSTYYRSATDAEVNNFIKNEKLFFENVEDFLSQADSWTRRRIALINDSNVLENYSIDIIISLANEMGILLNKKDNKLLIPSQKDEMKKVLGFLDEEAYKGPFSNALYLANSKRKI